MVAAAILPLLRPDLEELEEVAATVVMPESSEFKDVSAAAGVPEDGATYVAVNTGPGGNVAINGASPLSIIKSCNCSLAVEFHHLGIKVALYHPCLYGTDSQMWILGVEADGAYK